MSDHAHAEQSPGSAPHASHPPTNYVKIWAILCVLLVVSVLGPMLEIRVVTMVTAFGVAVVKAYLVATRFMHLNHEKKIVPYMLGTMLAIMALMIAAISPDVMKHEGTRWENTAAKESVKRGMLLHPGAHHDEKAPAGEPAAPAPAAPTAPTAPTAPAPAEPAKH